MSEKKRSAYQREMDQEHLSREKAGETLKLMLEKNRQLREAEAGRTARSGGAAVARRAVPAFAAVAAVAALLLILLRPAGVTFGSVRMSRLPVSGVSRGEEVREAGFATAFGCTAESLFPGWSVSDAAASVYPSASGTQYEGKLTLEKDRHRMEATVTRDTPALYTALGNAAGGTENARLNRDPDTGILWAVGRKGDLYITLSSADLSENDFVSAVKEITARWASENE
ncbi:MAG: hypothetical protein IKS31_03995 [Clostridia bacterium]|nr:hypothetical protein [Clostridia bacterium]